MQNHTLKEYSSKVFNFFNNLYWIRMVRTNKRHNTCCSRKRTDKVLTKKQPEGRRPCAREMFTQRGLYLKLLIWWIRFLFIYLFIFILKKHLAYTLLNACSSDIYRVQHLPLDFHFTFWIKGLELVSVQETVPHTHYRSSGWRFRWIGLSGVIF